MQTTVALLSMAAAAFAAPQSVGGANTQPAPAGCSPNYSGSFGITAVNITLPNSKRDLEAIVERQSNTGSGGATGPLVITLAGGVLSDSQNRVGNIVANHQFQFDPKPGQAGAIYTGGFSVCSNGSLALGSSAVFYSCLGSQPVSQGGFFNLYDTPAGNLCNPVLLVITPSGGSGSGGAVPQKTDGQPAVTGAAQKTDGQVVATPVAQKSDGQIIAPTAAAQKSDGQVIVASVAPPQVAQISDGQLQVVSIMQKSDGQVIAPTQGGVAQKSDGQVVATPAAGGVSQKSDGQIVATPAPVAQKSDGQIVATPAGAPVAQKSDGQPIATGAPAKNSTSPPLQVTNSASSFGLASGAVAIFAGVIAVAFL